MTHRSFQDRSGRRWEVWAVSPTAIERRIGADRRRASRPTPDRRQRPEARLIVAEELRAGWLAFECAGERRRLAPIPNDWMILPEPQLQLLAERATRLNQAVHLTRDA